MLQLRYELANRCVGKYWLIGHYGGFPTFLKEGSVKPVDGVDYDIKQSTMLFYQPTSKAWWLCHPSYGLDYGRTQWLAKGAIPDLVGMEQLSMVNWYVPWHANQQTTMLKVMSSHRWLGLLAKRDGEAKVNLERQIEDMRQHMADLEEENSKLKAQLSEAASAPSQPAKGYGRKDDSEWQPKAGWMNKMVAMLTALDLEKWSRVNYLKEKFMGHHTIEPLVASHKKTLEKWGKDPAYDY